MVSLMESEKVNKMELSFNELRAIIGSCLGAQRLWSRALLAGEENGA